MLKGTGDFKLTPKTTIVVFVKLPDQEPQSTRFTPLKPKASQKPQEKNLRDPPVGMSIIICTIERHEKNSP